MKDCNGNEIKRMEVYISVMVDVSGKTERGAYDASNELCEKVSGILAEKGIEVYDTYDVFRDDEDCIVEVKED